MTAPVLTLDHARSFEVPCRFEGESAVLVVRRCGSEWLVCVPGHGWGRPWDVWLTRRGWRTTEDDLFPSPRAALDAAFATDQIGAPE